jgi:hypothetical protein
MVEEQFLPTDLSWWCIEQPVLENFPIGNLTKNTLLLVELQNVDNVPADVTLKATIDTTIKNSYS